MNHRDIAAITAGLAPVIREFTRDFTKEYVASEMKPLLERIAALEQREPTPGLPGPAGEPGKDADPAVIERMVQDAVEKLPPAKDGKDFDQEAMAAAIGKAVEVAFAALPKPIDGKDGKSIEPGEVRLMVAEEVAKIPPAADGKSVTVDDVRPLIEGLVAVLPKAIDGKDGKSITADDVAPLITAEVAKAVASIPPAKDGAQGPQGIKGDPGRDGRDASDIPMLKGFICEEVRGQLGDTLKTISMDSTDAGRTVVFAADVNGESIRSEIKTAVPLDRGVWTEGSYQKGDGVSFGGSWFIAQQDTTAKPEESKEWRLAVQRGRKGRDGDRGPTGAKGDKGERGDRGLPSYAQ